MGSSYELETQLILAYDLPKYKPSESSGRRNSANTESDLRIQKKVRKK